MMCVYRQVYYTDFDTLCGVLGKQRRVVKCHPDQLAGVMGPVVSVIYLYV